MKWSMMMTEGSIQFNLEPEDEHERELVKSLEAYSGRVTIHKGVTVNECQGGYLRNFGERESVLAVKIDRRVQNDPL